MTDERPPRAPGEPRDLRQPGDERDLRATEDERDLRATADPIDKMRRGDPPDPIEAIVAHAAESMLVNAESMESLAVSIRGLGKTQHRTWLASALCVVILTVLLFTVWAYIIPLVNGQNAQRRILFDCVTPSKPTEPHQCSDRSAKAGFDLVTAQTYCTVNLARLNREVHSDEVRQCIASSLGIKLSPTPPIP